MSIRTLIEINHDYAHEIEHSEAFTALLCRNLCSGSGGDAEMLADYGVRVITMRHHADNFRIPEGTPGFPLKTKGPRDV